MMERFFPDRAALRRRFLSAKAWVLAAAGLGLVLACGPALATELTIGADIWCPYNCAEDATQPGFLVEIARRALNREDRTVRYRVLPWTRALQETQEARLDAAIGVVSGNYRDLILNRVSLGKDQTVVVTRREQAFEYRGVDSLRELLLGVVADYTYDANGPIDQYVWGNDSQSQVIVLHRENALELLMGMLHQRRIDGFLENRHVAAYTASRMNLAQHFRYAEIGGGDDIYFAFTRNVRGLRLADEFDEALLEMDRNGEIRAIMEKYGLPYAPLQRTPALNQDALAPLQAGSRLEQAESAAALQ